MMHTFYLVIGLMSVPFICIYLSYTLLVAGLPDYKQRVELPIRKRLAQLMEQRDYYFVFLLPCLNEEKVIRKTLQSILDLPHKHILALVIDDASDDNTASIVRAMRDKRVRLHQRKFPEARKGKGEALNSCYARVNRAVTRLGIDANQVIIGVIDGDGRPSPDILWEAMDAFADEKVGAAQSRVRITNRDKLLPFMQDLEFATTVGAMQNSREYFGSVGLGGNGQFTRLSALQSLGPRPWTKCLLEDFDLGLRILLCGWKIRFLSESHVAQQGLVSLRRFLRQRARWVQGDMQCLRYARAIIHGNLPKTAKLDLLYFLAQPWLNMLGTLIQLTAFGAMVQVLVGGRVAETLNTGHWVEWSLQLLLSVALVLGPGFVWVAIHREDFGKVGFARSVGAGLFFPVYNLLMIPSVWLAFWRHVARRNSWEKTDRLADRAPLLVRGETAL